MIKLNVLQCYVITNSKIKIQQTISISEMKKLH